MDTRTQIPPKKITYMNACERFARDPSAATVEECKIARVSTRPEPHRTWRAIAGVEEIDTCCAAFWLLIAMIIALFFVVALCLGLFEERKEQDLADHRCFFVRSRDMVFPPSWAARANGGGVLSGGDEGEWGVVGE